MIRKREGRLKKHNVVINRHRVSSRDALVDITIDGMVYSASSATDLLLCTPFQNVKPFILYRWSLEGLFQYSYGIFKWYFILKEDKERYYPRIIEVEFPERLDVEYTEGREIVRVLNARLEIVRNAINEYVDNPAIEDKALLRKVFKPIVQGRL